MDQAEQVSAPSGLSKEEKKEIMLTPECVEPEGVSDQEAPKSQDGQTGHVQSDNNHGVGEQEIVKEVQGNMDVFVPAGDNNVQETACKIIG